ncbi:MAG: DoxX family protein [Nanoarchaeota archaeon]|nr:DoxX family protein [Nanoarchaeota archaeon]
MQKIKNFIINNKNYATVVIRVSLALVLLWFGIDEIINPENWFGYIPSWLSYILPFSLDFFITLNGIFEIMIGVLLLIGLYTRIIAFIAALHLLSITIAVGYNEIGVRDFGLTLMAVSLIFSGAGVLSLGNKKEKAVE